MLNEISQPHKDKYCKISLICGIIFKAKFIVIESRIVVTRGWCMRGKKVIKRKRESRVVVA